MGPTPGGCAPGGSASPLDRGNPTPTPGPGRGWRLTGRPAMYLLASLIVALLAASSAPTPLYAIYQARWGFTPITTTVVFGVYAVAVLAALLTLGKLSDHVGRRPVLLAALLYVVSYLGLGLPAVAAGFLVVHGGGLTGTTRYYGAAVILLAALALLGLLSTRSSRAPAARTRHRIDKSV